MYLHARTSYWVCTWTSCLRLATQSVLGLCVYFYFGLGVYFYFPLLKTNINIQTRDSLDQSESPPFVSFVSFVSTPLPFGPCDTVGPATWYTRTWERERDALARIHQKLNERKIQKLKRRDTISRKSAISRSWKREIRKMRDTRGHAHTRSWARAYAEAAREHMQKLQERDKIVIGQGYAWVVF